MNGLGVSRRTFLAGSAAAVMGGCATLGRGIGAGARPNIIYAFSDEHRYQSMSFTDMPLLHTPTMERLAREGCSFSHCISNYPVCSPHRAMLLTGRWPFQTGVIDNDIALSRDEVTVGKVFQRAGYRTGYIGKWHLGGLRAEPFGFEHSMIWTESNTHWDSRYHPAAGGPVEAKGYNAALMTAQALAFLETEEERPFFLMVSWNPPHSDFLDAPEAKKALYPEGSLPFPPNFEEKAEGTDVLDRNGSPYYEGYHAHISAIDDELKRLMDALEARGLAENTILVYSSDHGSMQGSHGVGSKRQPYEESIRVPFLVWGAGVRPGANPRTLFGTIDVMPTLCGLAALRVPTSCVGKDFSGWIRGNAPERRPDPEHQLIMHISKENASRGKEHPAPLFRGLRTRRHTYAVGEHGPMCLFDNAADPYQMNNLIDASEQAKVREDLTVALREALAAAEDPFML